MVEWCDDCVPGDFQPATQVIPDRDAEFVTRLHKAEECISAIPADLASVLRDNLDGDQRQSG